MELGVDIVSGPEWTARLLLLRAHLLHLPLIHVRCLVPWQSGSIVLLQVPYTWLLAIRARLRIQHMCLTLRRVRLLHGHLYRLENLGILVSLQGLHRCHFQELFVVVVAKAMPNRHPKLLSWLLRLPVAPRKLDVGLPHGLDRVDCSRITLVSEQIALAVGLIGGSLCLSAATGWT